MTFNKAVPTPGSGEPTPGEPDRSASADSATDASPDRSDVRGSAALDIQRHVVALLTDSLDSLERRSRVEFEALQASRPHPIAHHVRGYTNRGRHLLLMIADEPGSGHGFEYKGLSMHVNDGVVIKDCAPGTLAVEIEEETRGHAATLPHVAARSTHTTRYRFRSDSRDERQHVAALEQLRVSLDAASMQPEVLAAIGEAMDAQGKWLSLRNVELVLTARQTRIAHVEELLALHQEIESTVVKLRPLDMAGLLELEPVSNTRFVPTGDVHVKLSVRPKHSKPGLFCVADFEAERDVFNETVPTSGLDKFGPLGEILSNPSLLDQLIAQTRQRALTIYDGFHRPWIQ